MVSPLFGMLLRHSPNNVCYSRIVRSASIPNNGHVTLCLLAQAFLTILRIQSEGSETCHQEGKENGTEGTTPAPEQTQDQQEPSRANIDLPVMVPLTLPEVRRLFYYLIEVPPFSSLYHLAWSCWRRMHQATAQLYHYKRRIASLPHLQL